MGSRGCPTHPSKLVMLVVPLCRSSEEEKRGKWFFRSQSTCCDFTNPSSGIRKQFSTLESQWGKKPHTNASMITRGIKYETKVEKPITRHSELLGATLSSQCLKNSASLYINKSCPYNPGALLWSLTLEWDTHTCPRMALGFPRLPGLLSKNLSPWRCC